MLINKNDKIFIAGHNGLVGKAIKKSLQKNNYQNLLFANRKNLDLLNSKLVEKWFLENNPDIVIIAAAKVGGINANSIYPADFIYENLKIQTNIIENAWKTNVKRLLFLGSSCIYPKFSPQPLKEEYLLTGPLEVTNESYAIAKIAGIKLCAALKMQYNFDAISLMPTNLYGPGDNYDLQTSHVLPALINKFYNAKINREPSVSCWGSGLPKREFLYVEDLSEACVFTLENISSNNKFLYDKHSKYTGIINVGTGLDIHIKDLAKLISETIGYEGEILWDQSKPDGTPRKVLDVSILSQLGWKAKTNLKDGIKLTLENYIKEHINKKI